MQGTQKGTLFALPSYRVLIQSQISFKIPMFGNQFGIMTTNSIYFYCPIRIIVSLKFEKNHLCTCIFFQCLLCKVWTHFCLSFCNLKQNIIIINNKLSYRDSCENVPYTFTAISIKFSTFIKIKKNTVRFFLSQNCDSLIFEQLVSIHKSKLSSLLSAYTQGDPV